MISTRSHAWIYCLVYVLVSLRANGQFVDITYVANATEKGAVCLDGSPPAYHLSPGFGSGVNSWLVSLEGGGWCESAISCLARRDTRLGSSKQMEKQKFFSGILSNEQSFNPDFYNWNKVKVRYCDGSSFTGDVEKVDPDTSLHYRGARVWLAVMEDLLAKGMSKAEYALLSGCSAGGLASIHHCDSFRALLPTDAKVKCLSDAGYFVNVNDITGTKRFEAYFNDIVTTHGSAKNLPSSCTADLKPGKCFFPQYIAEQIHTPLFILNAAYDSAQIRDAWASDVADPHGTWHDCKRDIKQCSASQIQTMQGFRIEFLNALSEAGTPSSRGLFINYY